jgi:hypothetical protein
MRFSIRDLLWLMVVAALALALWHERNNHLAFRESMLKWWSDHLRQEHFTNPNDYKRLVEREGPPFSG